jgi:hypothetical protein
MTRKIYEINDVKGSGTQSHMSVRYENSKIKLPITTALQNKKVTNPFLKTVFPSGFVTKNSLSTTVQPFSNLNHSVSTSSVGEVSNVLLNAYFDTVQKPKKVSYLECFKGDTDNKEIINLNDDPFADVAGPFMNMNRIKGPPDTILSNDQFNDNIDGNLIEITSREIQLKQKPRQRIRKDKIIIPSEQPLSNVYSQPKFIPDKIFQPPTALIPITSGLSIPDFQINYIDDTVLPRSPIPRSTNNEYYSASSLTKKIDTGSLDDSTLFDLSIKESINVVKPMTPKTPQEMLMLPKQDTYNRSTVRTPIRSMKQCNSNSRVINNNHPPIRSPEKRIEQHISVPKQITHPISNALYIEFHQYKEIMRSNQAVTKGDKTKLVSMKSDCSLAMVQKLIINEKYWGLKINHQSLSMYYYNSELSAWKPLVRELDWLHAKLYAQENYKPLKIMYSFDKSSDLIEAHEIEQAKILATPAAINNIYSDILSPSESRTPSRPTSSIPRLSLSPTVVPVHTMNHFDVHPPTINNYEMIESPNTLEEISKFVLEGEELSINVNDPGTPHSREYSIASDMVGSRASTSSYNSRSKVYSSSMLFRTGFSLPSPNPLELKSDSIGFQLPIPHFPHPPTSKICEKKHKDTFEKFSDAPKFENKISPLPSVTKQEIFALALEQKLLKTKFM